jgi:hypothetical protein
MGLTSLLIRPGAGQQESNPKPPEAINKDLVIRCKEPIMSKNNNFFP